MAAPKTSRKSPRAQVSLVARYRSPTAFEFVQEECFDLSLGGMFIRSPAPAPAGTLIKLECDVNGGAGAIRGVARVVWLREHGTDNQPAGMGVKFVKLDAGAREAIAGLLEQLGTQVEDRDTIRPTPVGAAATSDGAKGPFRPTPSARPQDESAAAPAAAAPARAAAGPSAQNGDAAQTDRITPIDAADAPGAAPAPQAQARSEAKTLKPPKSGKAAKAAAKTAAKAAAKPSVKPAPAKPASITPAAAKPKRAAASAGANTLPPTRARSNGLRAGVAAVLVVVVGVLVALSRQQASEDSGTAPAPGSTTTQAAVEPTPKVEQPEPAPSAATAAPAETAPPYVLDIATNPPGARVTAGDKVLTAPGQLDLGQLDEPMSLTAERDGFEPAAATIDRVGFMLEDGAMRRRIELNLTARAAVEPPQPAKIEPARVAPAPAAHEPKAEAVAHEPKVKAAHVARAAAAVPVERPSRSTKARADKTVAVAKEPAPEVAAKNDSAPVETQAPMQVAASCLAAGDNACVIRALEGKARSAREFELLIETYRATGATAKAETWMQSYLDKYPSERHANTYRRLLERRQGEASATP